MSRFLVVSQFDCGGGSYIIDGDVVGTALDSLLGSDAIRQMFDVGQSSGLLAIHDLVAFAATAITCSIPYPRLKPETLIIDCLCADF